MKLVRSKLCVKLSYCKWSMADLPPSLTAGVQGVFCVQCSVLLPWYHYHHQPGYSQNTTESAPLLQWPRRGHLLSRKNVYFRIQSVLAHRKQPWSKSAISIMCGPFQYLDIPEPSPRYEGCSNYPELQLASLSAAHHTSAALQCMQWHAHHLYCTAET